MEKTAEVIRELLQKVSGRLSLPSLQHEIDSASELTDLKISGCHICSAKFTPEHPIARYGLHATKAKLLRIALNRRDTKSAWWFWHLIRMLYI